MYSKNWRFAALYGNGLFPPVYKKTPHSIFSRCLQVQEPYMISLQGDAKALNEMLIGKVDINSADRVSM